MMTSTAEVSLETDDVVLVYLVGMTYIPKSIESPHYDLIPKHETWNRSTNLVLS